MLRRTAIPVLLAGWCGRASSSLAPYFDASPGAAILVDIRARRVLAVHRPAVAAADLAPPGSTLKPIALAALLRRKRIPPTYTFVCPGRLSIDGRSFDCVHPPLGAPLGIPEAIAYSCNCFVAHCAERFGPGELAADLAAAGLASRPGVLDGEAPGRIAQAAAPPAILLQALGEEGVAVSAAGLAMAYRGLSLAPEPAILEGLQGAVEFGTAQRARVAGLRVAGKTGSVARTAWFAGFAPSRAPEVAVAVILQARSGGGDAAPVAGRILAAWRAGRL